MLLLERTAAGYVYGIDIYEESNITQVQGAHQEQI